jgi:asparagine synthase (glutamine-hydrolysing)
MCGICGYINPEGATEAAIDRMASAIAHRGPDGQGIFTRGPVGLGHRRLSIIDLEGGRQPMANEDDSIWITFNGEIYNYPEIRRELEARHRFKTHSDTEVILHLYEEKGEKCLDDLRGMFAFAIYDFRERKLFVARDHLGQKPLYYHHDGDRFSFASEIKSLLALCPELAEMDETALYEYLTLRIIAPPRSMFRKIRKLPPAHFLIYQDGKISIHRYWHLRYEPKRQGDFRSTLEELDRQMMSTVRYHLVSDVPVGAFFERRDGFQPYRRDDEPIRGGADQHLFGRCPLQRVQ